MNAQAPSDFARVRRLAKRGAYDAPTIHAILDAATICHVAHVIEGRPVAIPTLHWRDGGRVYWHGNSAGRMPRANAAGGQVCLTATLLDSFVLARSAFHHSANYRSVMCFGSPELVADPEEKTAALRGFVERLFPGRWEQLRPMTGQELKATSVLSMPLDEVSAKLRTGPPVDDAEDLDWPVWAGIVPIVTSFGAPEQDGQSQALKLPTMR